MLELYENFIVVTIREGVLFDTAELQAIHEIFDTFYPTTNFGYISNRINDYTINPTCYFESSKYPRLLGMAIICNTESGKRMANYEKSFYKRPYEVFESMETGEQWIHTLLKSSTCETAK